MSREFKINNVAIAYPAAGFKVSLEDISDEETGRSLSGLMSKQIIAQKTTVELSWRSLPDNKSSVLLQAIKGSNLQDAQGKTYVNLTYPDPVAGTNTTKQFYTGTPTCTLAVCVDDKCYWNIDLHFIER